MSDVIPSVTPTIMAGLDTLLAPPSPADQKPAPKAAPAPSPQPTPPPRDINMGTVMPTPMYAPTKAEFDKIPPGVLFRDPKGQVRRKPYEVTDDKSFQAVPLGAQYLEDGQLKTKYKAAGGIDPRAQTLFDMAHTPDGQKKALEYFYGPGTVHDDRGDIYVLTRDGQRLSPKATTLGSIGSRVLGATAAGALPAAGSAVGALAGGISGLPGGPAGSIGVGLAGAGAGGAAGEAANQEILRLLGVEKLPGGRAAGEMGISGLTGSLGSLLFAAPGAARSALGSLRSSLPAALRWFVGANPEKLAIAKELVKEGARPSLSSYAEQAPFVGFLESIAKQFGYDPAKESAKTWMPKVMDRLLEQAGVPAEERNVVGQTAAVSLEPAGRAAVARSQAIIGQANEKLNAAIEAYRAEHVQTATLTRDAAQKALDTAGAKLTAEADASRTAANTALKQELDAIQHETETALKGAGASPGDLSRSWGKRIGALRQQLSQDAGRLYTAADTLAAGHEPNVAPLRQWAAGLIDSVPDAVAAEYPKEVEILSKLAGRESAAGTGLVDELGKPIQGAAAPVTFSDLHQLRTFLRSKVDWGDLTRGPRQGVLMRLEQAVDQTINSQEAAPELQAAAKALRHADDFYRENIRRFEDATVRQLAQFGQAVAAPDVAELAKLTLRQGNTERIRMLREMGGPDLWNRVVAADTQAMLNEAGAQGGKLDAQKFATEILDRANSGVLKEAYTPAQAERLRLQADRIARVYGRVPMQPRPGDTVFTLMDRTDALIKQAEGLAKKQPMELFRQSMKQIDTEIKAMRAAGNAEIGQNPLRAFTNLGAEEAAKRILSSPDMIAAVEREFGPNSSEFTMLRQTYARQVLQRIADATLPIEGRRGGGLTQATEAFLTLPPETQQRLFPGTTSQEMVNLIRKVVLMFPGADVGFGSSLAGTSAIAHPSGSTLLGKNVGRFLKGFPEPVSRFMLAKALDKISSLATSPRLVEFMAKGLDGKPPGREAAEAALRAFLQDTSRSGAAGAAIGEYGGRQANTAAPDQQAAPPAPIPSWRERAASDAGTPPPNALPSWRDLTGTHL